jgi:hypothetical protein
MEITIEKVRFKCLPRFNSTGPKRCAAGLQAPQVDIVAIEKQEQIHHLFFVGIF